MPKERGSSKLQIAVNTRSECGELEQGGAPAEKKRVWVGQHLPQRTNGCGDSNPSPPPRGGSSRERRLLEDVIWITAGRLPSDENITAQG